ncbi:hypothetical protein FH972_021970 [Carpinus fangiana]|uniref:Uncharacterized protein n=1 Tax=Carpinus fangiana TaxID=176857 RepID=A0A5N6KRI4_9ROSI|nr:hypothetical protein FH972_021970 [Carpinus fangiana]
MDITPDKKVLAIDESYKAIFDEIQANWNCARFREMYEQSKQSSLSQPEMVTVTNRKASKGFNQRERQILGSNDISFLQQEKDLKN